MKEEEDKKDPAGDPAELPKPKKERQHNPHKAEMRAELEKRLKSEISPFTLQDLPLSDNDQDELFAERYLFQKVLGAGSFGVVVAAVDRVHLEQCAIKVTRVAKRVDHIEGPGGQRGGREAKP